MSADNEVSKPFLYFVMIGMLVSGTANTLVQKYQDEEQAAGNIFTHPYFQTAIMFMGELSIFGAYGVKKVIRNRTATKTAEQGGQPDLLMSPGTTAAVEQKLLTNCNPLLLAIPATCDFCGSTLMFIALTMVDASVYQMMRGMIVVVTALFAMVFLGKKQYRHHWTAIVLIVAGVAEVGYISIKYTDTSASSSSSPATGIIILMGAQLFVGTQFVVEEKLLSKYYLDPFKIVGTEGMWGVLYWLFALPIMQVVKCGGPDATGLGSLCHFGRFENSAYAFKQMGENSTIIYLSLAMMLSIGIFNVCGVSTTKYATAAQRSTVDTSRTLLIWIMSVSLGLETFHWEAIIGFVMLVSGTLLYNEIVVLPFLGFDQNTKEKIAEREGGNGSKRKDAAYMSLSPGKGHQQAARNTRNLDNTKKDHYGEIKGGADEDFDMQNDIAPSDMSNSNN